MVAGALPEAATMPQTPPLSLSDEEYAIVERAAPVHLLQRSMFLQALADELARHSVIGQGLIHRLCADLQRRYLIEGRSEAEPSRGEAQNRHQHAG